MLKLEHKIKEAYFVAPNIYWLKDADTGAEVVKCKGYPGELTKEQRISKREFGLILDP